jgi:hypothetical protein
MIKLFALYQTSAFNLSHNNNAFLSVLTLSHALSLPSHAFFLLGVGGVKIKYIIICDIYIIIIIKKSENKMGKHKNKRCLSCEDNTIIYGASWTWHCKTSHSNL